MGFLDGQSSSYTDTLYAPAAADALERAVRAALASVQLEQTSDLDPFDSGDAYAELLEPVVDAVEQVLERMVAAQLEQTSDLDPFDSGDAYAELLEPVVDVLLELLRAASPLQLDYGVVRMSLLDAIFAQRATRLATSGADVLLADGPPGAPGDVLTLAPDSTHGQWKPPSGGSSGLQLVTADETLLALRVVRLVPAADKHVVYARPPEVAARVPLGITLTSATAGSSVECVDAGELTDNAWNWTVGAPVLLGANGALTQTQPPTQPYLVVIGTAITAKTLAIQISQAITLAL